ncbi:TPA: hypothetical protein DEP90_01770 [Patescibacteria group bacterium]|nr:hypothetical protein [Patescibacteria group bacterium]
MKNRLKGITLMETVLYIGLFSVITLIILNFMLSLQETTLRTKRKSDLHQASEFMIRHLDYSFTKALSINELNSVFENSNGVLELMFESGNKQYYLTDSKFYFNGTSLTTSSILVSDFFVTPVYTGSSNLTGVKINMILISSEDVNFTKSVDILLVL